MMKVGPCKKTAFLGPSEMAGPEGFDKSLETGVDEGSPEVIYEPWTQEAMRRKKK